MTAKWSRLTARPPSKFTGFDGAELCGLDFRLGGRSHRTDRHGAVHLRAAGPETVNGQAGSAVDGIQSMTKTSASDDIHNFVRTVGRYSSRAKGRARGPRLTHHEHYRPDCLGAGHGGPKMITRTSAVQLGGWTTSQQLGRRRRRRPQDMIADITMVVTNASSGKGTRAS